MRGALLALALAVLAAGTARAGTLSLEAGRGFHHSQHVEAAFLRYELPASFRVLDCDTYYEAMAGAWNNDHHNLAAALSIGIRLPWHDDDRFFGSAGMGGVRRDTDNLGTRFQFTFHVGYTKRLNGFLLSLGYVHFSNGKYFFGQDGPNYGENFTTLQAGWEL